MPGSLSERYNLGIEPFLGLGGQSPEGSHLKRLKIDLGATMDHYGAFSLGNATWLHSLQAIGANHPALHE